jgi:hypothetical protein
MEKPLAAQFAKARAEGRGEFWTGADAVEVGKVSIPKGGEGFHPENYRSSLKIMHLFV